MRILTAFRKCDECKAKSHVTVEFAEYMELCSRCVNHALVLFQARNIEEPDDVVPWGDEKTIEIENPIPGIPIRPTPVDRPKKK